MLLLLHLTSCTVTRLRAPDLVRGRAQLSHTPSGGAGRASRPLTFPHYRAPDQHQAQKAEAKSWNKTESFKHLCWNRPNEYFRSYWFILQVTVSLLKQGTSRSSVKLSKQRRWLLYFCTVNSAHSGNSKPFFFFLINLCSQKCVSWNCYCGGFFSQFYCNSRSILFSLNMRGWVGKLGETWTTYKFCIVSSIGNNNSFGTFQNPSPHGRTKAVPLCVLALQKWGKKLYSQH